jgi:hypothetical protein
VPCVPRPLPTTRADRRWLNAIAFTADAMYDRCTPMTTAALPASDLECTAIRRPRRSRPANPRPMYGFSAAHRWLRGNNPRESFAAAARRPVYLPDEAMVIVRRIADPSDPIGKRRPIPWPPVTTVPVPPVESASG